MPASLDRRANPAGFYILPGFPPPARFRRRLGSIRLGRRPDL